MPTTDTDPELLHHFTVAVYPFLHDFSAANRSARLRALTGRWLPWWDRLSDREAAIALEGSAFFLPYVRGLLYPDVAALHGQEPGHLYTGWVERVREETRAGPDVWAGALPPSAVLHLTCMDAAYRPPAEFTVMPPETGPRSPAEAIAGAVDWIDALLFPSGLGFLLLKARLASAAPRLAQLIELNHALRLVHPPTLSWTLPQLRFQNQEPAGTLRDLLNCLTAPLARDWTAGAPSDWAMFRRRPAPQVPYTETEAGRCYGERCQILSYACIHLTDETRAALPAGPFGDGEERLLFEYAAGIGLGATVENPMWVPAPEQVARLRRENRLALWRCWKAMALKEGCAFLATEDLPFTRRSLAHNVERHYLPLYLYTLHQKFQLLLFASDLMREVAQVEGHLHGARELLRRFVAFRNRFWFSEVTRKPQGSDLYRAMQQSLEVPELYQMVVGSVKEAKEYYQERWDRQVRLGLTMLSLGGTAMAALKAVQAALVLVPTLWAVAIGLVLALAGGGAVLVLARGRSRGYRALRGRRRRKPRQLRTKRSLPFPSFARVPRSRAG